MTIKMITPEDVKEFEESIGESLLDSNNWTSNPYVIYGFARARGEVAYSERLLAEIKEYGYYAEAFAPDLFQDDEGKEQTDYAAFVAAVVNTIPEYNARWWANIDEMFTPQE